MRFHILQHESFEKPGHIERWAKRRKMPVEFTHFWEPGWRLPEPKDVDMVVSMGGPMSVHDEKIHPWLIEEMRFMDSCIQEGKKVLGVCLGAQIAAHVLGADVRKNHEKEIGWYEVFKTDERHPVFAAVPQESMMFHWHGETFDIPAGAMHLAYSEACENQAFIWNSQVLGLQFHPEVAIANVEEFVKSGEAELKAGGLYVQTAHQIRTGESNVLAMEMALSKILEAFVLGRSSI